MIDVATSAAEAFAKRLDLYKLRADAAFALTGDEFAVAVAWGDEMPMHLTTRRASPIATRACPLSDGASSRRRMR